MKRITVLGAGTWGTALARMLSNTGSRVTVWSALDSEVSTLSETRAHPNLPARREARPQIYRPLPPSGSRYGWSEGFFVCGRKAHSASCSCSILTGSLFRFLQKFVWFFE